MTLAAQQDPLLGAILEGRYRVERLIGRGGMGNVYAAEDIKLRRLCALKILKPEFAEDRGHVDRFLREAQAIAQLAHANIVDIYSFGEDPSGIVFFAMELLTGEDLEARIRDRERRPFSWREACAWGVQIAQAVGNVHAHGLVHRDLKPANIFLARRRDGSEVLKLLDFGIVRAEDGAGMTRTGTMIGTPHYMSPEQVKVQAIDRRSDVYSFGVLLYKLVTGGFPFKGEPFQVAIQHATEPPPAFATVAPGLQVPAALEAFVLRAMAKLPADRPQSMEACAHELSALLAAAPATEGPPVPSAVAAARPVPAPVMTAAPPTGPPSRAADVVRDDEVITTVASSLELTIVPSSSHLSLEPSAEPAPTLVSREPRAASGRRLTAVLAIPLAAALLLAYVFAGGEREPPAPTAAPAPALAPAAPIEPSPAGPPAPSPPPEPPPADEPVIEVPPDDAPDPNLPPLESELSRPRASKTPRKAEGPEDPQKVLARKARACRKKHGAVGGPPIVVDYVVRSDGHASKVTAQATGALADCLAEAVRSTQFAPQLALGQQASL